MTKKELNNINFFRSKIFCNTFSNDTNNKNPFCGQIQELHIFFLTLLIVRLNSIGFNANKILQKSFLYDLVVESYLRFQFMKDSYKVNIAISPIVYERY